MKVIDPNDEDGRTRVMPLDRFLYWWDGFTLVLDPAGCASEDAAGSPSQDESSQAKTVAEK